MDGLTVAPQYVLTISSPDRPGIVHATSGVLVDHGCSIVESQQFGRRDSEAFFMRVQFEPTAPAVFDPVRFERAFAGVAAGFGMRWILADTARRARVLLMVSRFGHCMNDLLFRAWNGDLPVEIPAVMSNHPDLAGLAESYRVPFHHVPVTADTKRAAEGRLLEVVEELSIDLVVLARYMQILSPELCAALEGRAINIHHSMLPSFKGARPYVQAYERGVKLVGATAHYVTADLDEGPIIEQSVTRVDHAMTAADVTSLGRETECAALARAVRWHVEHRTLLDGQRVVVFG